MKKVMCLLTMLSLIILSITGCSGDRGPEYCMVDGCPREVLTDRSYCAEHKCHNFSCDNEATVSFGYCNKCLERAYN